MDDLLKLVQALLPTSVAFDADLYASEDDLFASFEVDSQLDDIAVIDRIRTTLHAGTAQTDVVEEGAGTTLDILDEPLTIVAPQFAVSPADDLALESNGVRCF